MFIMRYIQGEEEGGDGGNVVAMKLSFIHID
jgi:hypothetical protein